MIMSSIEQQASVVSIGDKIKVYWPNNEGEMEKVFATVTGVKLCSKMKQNSLYKYTLCFHNSDDEEVERSTRLLHLKWKKLARKQKKSFISSSNDECLPSKKIHKDIVIVECAGSSNDECLPLGKKQKRVQNSSSEVKFSSTKKNSTCKALPAHSRIVAPMVGGSELAFRLLCR